MTKTYRQGFTIIEAIIVILILAIIAVVLINTTTDITLLRTNQAAVKIRSDLRYAQSYALAAQDRTLVLFDSASESYEIYAEDGSWVLVKNPVTKEDFIVDFAGGDYAGVDIVSTNFGGTGYGVVFDAAGTPYGYNPATGSTSVFSTQGSISLGQGVSVIVEPQTGTVSLIQ